MNLQTSDSFIHDDSDDEWMPAAAVHRGQKSGRGKGTVKRGRGASGRARGRARGRGRGGNRSVVLETSQSREERMKALVRTMDEERVRDTLTKAISFHPGLIFDIIEPMARQSGGYHPFHGSTQVDWCACSRCREMPTAAERVCCGKSKENCISTLPDFQVLILDEAVLSLARLYRRDVLVLNQEVDVMKANRHQGYRQFILWQHGRLGAGSRKVIRSCCVWRIRDTYPDAFGQYTGYIPGRLA
ncbi:uncharacterized protein [Argopecten irradians]|uniref:uncharacterized protein n=1 Tax=Argopecten irradians TaxID=31199 RepID=UPI0037126A3D